MKLIVKTVFGSHVYGTNLPTSDTDLKGVFIPDLKDLLLQRAKATIVTNTKLDATKRNEAGDTDVEIFALHQFMKLLCEGQTGALDLLFTPKKHWITSSPTWTLIQHHREKFLHSGVSAFAGYCQQQAAKYGIKGSRISTVRQFLRVLEDYSDTDRLRARWIDIIQKMNGAPHFELVDIKNPAGVLEPYLSICNRKVNGHIIVNYARELFTRILNEYGHRARQAETNEGVDWKALMHAFRVCCQAHELLLTRNITFPRPEADILLQIRKGELPYREVAEMIEMGLDEMKNAQRYTVLPKTVDTDFIDRFIFYEYCYKSDPGNIGY